jgi:trans-aconitate methyltransferase
MRQAVLLMVVATSVVVYGQNRNSAVPPEEIPPHLVYIPMDVADRMLADAAVTSSDVVYDLGCGDGRVSILAVKKYGARVVAVDNNPKRIAEARENATKEGVVDRITFVQQNMVDLSPATVVTMSSPQSMSWLALNGLLDPTLTSQLKPGARLISNFVPGSMKEWKPDRVDHFADHGKPRATLFMWKIAERR